MSTSIFLKIFLPKLNNSYSYNKQFCYNVEYKGDIKCLHTH